MSFTFARDVTALFYSQVPKDRLLAGYDTGSGGIAWTPAMWKANPGAVHVDQDVNGSDFTADILDCEAGAVPVGSMAIPAWVRGAQAAWNTAKRPGQRRPALYCSASNVTSNVNALIRGGMNSGTGLWIAKWDGNTAADIAALAAAAGPFPVIGFQYADDGDWDSDVFSSAWLADVSGKTPPKPPVNWVYDPCRSVTVRGGLASVAGAWVSPDGPPGAPGIGGYQVQVRYADGPKKGQDLYTPMRYTPKSPSANEAHQYGSLPRNTALVFMVRAVVNNTDADGHGGDWTTAPFRTS